MATVACFITSGIFWLLTGCTRSSAWMNPSRVPSAANTSLSDPGLRCLSEDSGGAEEAVLNTQARAAPPASSPHRSTTRRPSRTYRLGRRPRRRRRIRAEWLKTGETGILGRLLKPFRLQACYAAQAQVRLVRGALGRGGGAPGRRAPPPPPHPPRRPLAPAEAGAGLLRERRRGAGDVHAGGQPDRDLEPGRLRDERVVLEDPA